jgi:hypothetical protein
MNLQQWLLGFLTMATRQQSHKLSNSGRQAAESDFVTAETGNRGRLSNGSHQAVQSDFLTVATNMQQSHELVTVSLVQKGWTF